MKQAQYPLSSSPWSFLQFLEQVLLVLPSKNTHQPCSHCFITSSFSSRERVKTVQQAKTIKLFLKELFGNIELFCLVFLFENIHFKLKHCLQILLPSNSNFPHTHPLCQCWVVVHWVE